MSLFDIRFSDRTMLTLYSALSDVYDKVIALTER